MTPVDPSFFKITNKMIYNKIIDMEKKINKLTTAYYFIMAVGSAALIILFTR